MDDKEQSDGIPVHIDPETEGGPSNGWPNLLGLLAKEDPELWEDEETLVRERPAVSSVA